MTRSFGLTPNEFKILVQNHVAGINVNEKIGQLPDHTKVMRSRLSVTSITPRNDQNWYDFIVHLELDLEFYKHVGAKIYAKVEYYGTVDIPLRAWVSSGVNLTISAAQFEDNRNANVKHWANREAKLKKDKIKEGKKNFKAKLADFKMDPTDIVDTEIDDAHYVSGWVENDIFSIVF